MVSDSRSELAVIGAGAWGTTLANHIAQTGRPTLIWAFEKEVCDEINSNHTNPVYLEGCRLHESLKATNDLSDLSDINRLIIAIPSKFFARSVKGLNDLVSKDCLIVSATKGFIDDTLRRPSDHLKELLPENPIGVLSGPNLSREVSMGLPAISLVASEEHSLVREFQDILSTERFRVYGGSDVAGTELGGALKNIMAIAAGMSDGLGLGENALAALITRGLAEMIKLGGLFGADERTFFGISGLGDLVCTSQSRLSRNQQVGRRIALGESLDEILTDMTAVAEGVETTRHVHEYAVQNNVELPITGSVHNILFEKADPSEAIRNLMTRTLKME